MVSIKTMEKAVLKDQILKGKQWLKKHSHPSDDPTASYSEETWEKKLHAYEHLVDEWHRRGYDPSEILETEEIKEEEKKIRKQLTETSLQGSYHLLWKKWFTLREEGVRRGVFKFFVPAPEE